MPEIEDFLSSIEDDEDQEQERPQVDPKKLGYALRQEQKEKKALAKKLAELEAFQTEVLREKQQVALRAAGLNDFHAEVYAKFFEDVNEENVAAYKAKAGLADPEPQPEPEVAPETRPNPGGFAPASQGIPVGKPMISREDFDAMLKNPATRADALKAANEGRVKLNNEAAADVQVTDTAGFFSR